jgi:uncharacterized membrane protein HdeD (DUF308 family)
MTNTPSSKTTDLFIGRWWGLLLRGLTAVAFGVIALTSTHGTFAKLIPLLGLYALVHGIFSLAAAVTSRGRGSSTGLLVLEGVIGIGAGFLLFVRPQTSLVVLTLFVWAWAIATGIVRIAEAVQLRKQVPGEVWLALSGIVSVIFALIWMLRPIFSALALAGAAAAYVLLLGVSEIMLGCELRALRRPQRL